MTVSLNKNSFCLHVQLIPFCIKTNLRENRFFAARWAIVGENCTHNVKFITENKTKQIALCTRAKATAMESMYAYNRQREQLLDILPTTNGNRTMETQKASAINSLFSALRKSIKWFPPVQLLNPNHVLSQPNRSSLRDCRFFVRHFVLEKNVYHGFTAQRKRTPLYL